MEPYTPNVRGASSSRAVDTNAEAVSIEALRDGASKLDTVLTPI